MYEEDYVKRLIALLARAIVRLIQLVQGNDLAAARTEVHYILTEVFGVSESMILGLGEEDILDLIFRGGPRDPEVVGQLAEVLRIKAAIAGAEGHLDQAMQWHQASLRYLVAAVDTFGYQPDEEVLRSFETGIQSLLPDGLSSNLLASLYALYRRAGNHAVASRLIVAYASKGRGDAEGVREAQTYLMELRGMGEEALQKCGLSVERVAAMLAEVSPKAR